MGRRGFPSAKTWRGITEHLTSASSDERATPPMTLCFHCARRIAVGVARRSSTVGYGSVSIATIGRERNVDRKSVVKGKSESVRGVIGGCRNYQQKKEYEEHI